MAPSSTKMRWASACSNFFCIKKAKLSCGLSAGCGLQWSLSLSRQSLLLIGCLKLFSEATDLAPDQSTAACRLRLPGHRRAVPSVLLDKLPQRYGYSCWKKSLIRSKNEDFPELSALVGLKFSEGANFSRVSFSSLESLVGTKTLTKMMRSPRP